MDNLTHAALLELKFALMQSKTQFGICVNQAVPRVILNNSPVQNFFYCQEEFAASNVTDGYVRGELVELPFLTDSLDVIVVWHNLDAINEINQVIREFWRVLSPYGMLLIIGLNRVNVHSKQVFLQKRSTIVRNLIHQGFAIEVEKTFGFFPQCSSVWVNKILQSLEIISQFCLPMLGTHYFIQARKPVLGMTALLSTQIEKTQMHAQGIIEPAGRV